MKLIEILKMIDKNIPFIAYRNIVSIDSDDVDLFTGACRWNDNKLISLDGDDYSLDEEISKYDYNEELNQLTIWRK